MLQREVAERLVAVPGDEDYAALTILLGRRWCVHKTRIVPPDVFWPRPRVESAIVTIKRRPIREVRQCNETVFREMVRLGFSSRRKQLSSLLKISAERWLPIMDHLGHPSTIRAEDLSIDDWSYLVDQIAPLSSKSEKEFFDVVDGNDSVIDRQERNFVHVNKFTHRSVHVWVFNARGELFLQKRSYWKENHPGLWCSSVAGHVMAGENYLEAATRELREELGVNIELKLFHSIPASEATEQEFVACFFGIAEGPFVLQAEEIETGAFFSIETIKQWIASHSEEFTPLLKMIVKEFLEKDLMCAFKECSASTRAF
jgi:16S rRNA (adenine1518-N6/adenine1519-N6)-dimethyltransferase